MDKIRTWGYPGRQKPTLLHVLVRCCLILLCGYRALAADVSLHSQNMTLNVHSADGSYDILGEVTARPVIHAAIAAEVDHKWLRSTQYPKHDISESVFTDQLGKGHKVVVRSTGLAGVPDITYTIQMYDTEPFGAITAEVRNSTANTITIQDIRSVEAIGERPIDTGDTEGGDRILSDSFGEGWPPLQIRDLGQAQQGLHRAVGSQLIYNRKSKQSLFFGALTADRFLTILRLGVRPGSSQDATITSYQVDSTGTTEMQASPESGLRHGPAKYLVDLSLPVTGNEALSSERVMFSVGTDYHDQLERYGLAIRVLHNSRVSSDNLLGWWSWTAYYQNITQGASWTNAQWLAENLKPLGFDYFHFDLGYSYARGEYMTPDAVRFPQGMWDLTHRISRLGLQVGIWTAPFEIEASAWVYEHHKDWLVHNAQGEPIPVGKQLFVLDTTNPGAQEYIRQTYKTLVKEWGARYFKLDFMDTTAVEGYYYKPNTTALEALRTGLEVIRNAVGDDVLIDKDGSPMLTPVGIVDEGRVSTDTGHTFLRTKVSAPGIAARYYMNRNFFVNDPDAFTVSKQKIEERYILQTALSLSEAQASIALAAVSGGMYEIGDDLPKLGEDPSRLELVKNADLLQMVKLGHAATPVDLMTYQDADAQPSVFLLREDSRQSVLAVFNWTEEKRSHELRFSELGFSEQHPYRLYDSFADDRPLPLTHGSIQINDQLPHSVRLIKIIDNSIPAAAPTIKASLPDNVKAGVDVQFSCVAAKNGVPVLAYHWDFGDGVKADGARLTHTYTEPGTYTVQLTADGLDGLTWERRSSLTVGAGQSPPAPQRYVESER